MERIDVVKNEDNMIGHMMFEAFGRMKNGDVENIIERDEGDRVKPVRVELKFNGHDISFRSYITYLGRIYTKEVEREAKSIIGKMVPEKISDIYDKLNQVEDYCESLVNEIEW